MEGASEELLLLSSLSSMDTYELYDDLGDTIVD